MENTEVVTPEKIDTIEMLSGLELTISDKKPEEEPVKEAGTELDGAAENKAEKTAPIEQKQEEPVSRQKEEEVEDVVITSEDLAEAIKEETGGLLNSMDDVLDIIEENKELQERIKELEKNPESLYKNPKQVAIHKFLSEYKGEDFHTGILTYSKLQSLDIPKMSSEDALRESYVMDKSQQGISRADAEDMFSVEFERKYGEFGEKAEKFINADAYDAKKKLEAAKQAYLVEEKVDDTQTQKQEEFKQARANYEKSVEASISGYKTMTIADLTPNPENDFTYEVENVDEVREAMDNYQGWFESKYVSSGKVDTEQMKQDLTIVMNFPKISQMLFEHGKTLGKEAAIMERQNIPNKNTPQASNHASDKPVPATWLEGLRAGKEKN